MNSMRSAPAHHGLHAHALLSAPGQRGRIIAHRAPNRGRLSCSSSSVTIAHLAHALGDHFAALSTIAAHGVPHVSRGTKAAGAPTGGSAPALAPIRRGLRPPDPPVRNLARRFSQAGRRGWGAWDSQSLKPGALRTISNMAAQTNTAIVMSYQRERPFMSRFQRMSAPHVRISPCPILEL